MAAIICIAQLATNQAMQVPITLWNYSLVLANIRLQDWLLEILPSGEGNTSVLTKDKK